MGDRMIDGPKLRAPQFREVRVLRELRNVVC